MRLSVSHSVSLGVEPNQLFITVWQLRSNFCGASSLTGGRLCLLSMLLVLASADFLGSGSLGTHDHILLSQIWDFCFRRLLRFAGSRRRYSNPSPHGLLKTVSQSKSRSHIATDGQSVCQSSCRAPFGAHYQLFITDWPLQFCYCGAPILTRGRFCLYQRHFLQ
jgi:hypothetical protein